jgi:uncharacterized membrane protein
VILIDNKHILGGEKMYKKGAKTIRLVVGIISIVLSCFIMFQSCAAGVVNTVSDSGDSGGTAGLFLSLIMIASGIVSIAARKTKGGIITSIVFYIVGAIIAFTNAKVYTDLIVWGVVALIFSALLIMSLFMKEKDNTI